MGIGWAGARPAPRPPDGEPVGPAVVTTSSFTAADAWLRLDAPARQDELVTNQAIIVRGEVGPGVAEIWIGLESRTGKVLASKTIERRGPRVGASMPFEKRFRLASMRASGRLFVTATAIGRDGVPTQSIRRRIDTAVAEMTDPPTRHVLVKGWVARDVGEIRLMLTSSTSEPLAISAIDPTGGPRNGMVPFEAAFQIPGVTPETPLFVVPTDATGEPRDPGPGLLVEGGVVELVVR